jgi:putative aldouronate transport system substrate-binding protein
MKKLMISIAALTLAASVFAGGSKASGTQGSGLKGPKGSLPISDGSVTLTAFIGGLNNWVTSFDYKDNLFTKRIVDETGIKLEFIAASGADATQKRNVLLSSGDYPDIFFGGLDISYYAPQGIIIPLDAYELMSYPNIKAAFDEYPALADMVRGQDGKIYGLPVVNDCFHCHYSHGRSFYYMPFIRDNKQKVPETLNELAAYLRYVRDNDLNGNGNKGDEIPLAFERAHTLYLISGAARAYMPFIHNWDYFGLALDEKRQVVEQYKDPKYREALRYLAELYREKLILPDSFSMTRDQLKALAENPVPLLAMSVASNPDNIGVQGGGRLMNYFMMAPVAGPQGARYSGYRGPWDGLGVGMVITDRCKNPELAVALYNYFLNFDVQLDGYIGPKGVCWDDPDPGTLSLMGEKPLYQFLMQYSAQPVNAGWNQENPMIRSNLFRLGEQATDFESIKQWIDTGDSSFYEKVIDNASYNEAYLYYNTQTKLVPYKIDDEYFIPPVSTLYLNDADNSRMADIKASLESYKEQAAVEFITGKKNINDNGAWNTYLAELDRLNSAELANILQKYIR